MGNSFLICEMRVRIGVKAERHRGGEDALGPLDLERQARSVHFTDEEAEA